MQTAFPGTSYMDQEISSTTMDDGDDMDIDLGPLDAGVAIELVSCLKWFRGNHTNWVIRSQIRPLPQAPKLTPTPAAKLCHGALILRISRPTKFTFGA